MAGLDLEMPNGQFFNAKLLQAIKDEELPVSLIDEKVSRILGQIVRIGLLDGADTNRPPVSAINSPENQKAALQMARESLVLLKNIMAPCLLMLKSKKDRGDRSQCGRLRQWRRAVRRVDPFYKIFNSSGFTKSRAPRC